MPKSKKSKTKKSSTKDRFDPASRNFTIIIAVLLVCFGLIVFRNVLINQSFSEVQSMQKEISNLQKENSQISINIQNSMNLSIIETLASSTLGMQKLSSKQTIYISLDTKDYVEVNSNSVDDNSENFITVIWNKFLDLF